MEGVGHNRSKTPALRATKWKTKDRETAPNLAWVADSFRTDK